MVKELTTTYSDKKFSSAGVVILPQRWRNTFGYQSGEQVDVILKGNEIIIQKADYRTFNLKRYLAEKGAVAIPIEIRKSMGIKPHQPFTMKVDVFNKRFILSFKDQNQDAMTN
ncbi:AbrB/MazE/SpoVT family DNA-binding domain-containing protein [Neobacillus terrae]|uniref:AbrB/MazE/SpoVT family DNA-binding domain-containing protein n=1 Tax=Neobacillus terrae TaxID=3034837 RepID=UPI00140AA450|nr:AbrB/MazE/SpoVT family DNA-binding domain-containing protein [Neobacillus terrae]NHM33736.1 hypothetical protein [Neobacillus terrae]